MAIKVVIAYTADMATELRSEGMAAENIQGMLGHRAYRWDYGRLRQAPA